MESSKEFNIIMKMESTEQKYMKGKMAAKTGGGEYSKVKGSSTLALILNYIRLSISAIESLRFQRRMKVKTKKMIILMVISGCLSACGEELQSSKGSSKDLFSKWTNQVNGIEFDFTGGTYGPQAFRYYVNATNGCDCTLEVLGTNDSGTASLSSCSHFGATDYCTAGTVIYNYTNENATLTLCDTGCEEWK